MGEPRAGRSDIVEGLARAISPESTRFPLTDDLDFHNRERLRPAEVEVTLGSLGPALTQRFFDYLEFRDRGTGALIDELDEVAEVDAGELEEVVRLCYRAEWSDAEGMANHWVYFPKTSVPEEGLFNRIRREDRVELPVFFSAQVGSRPLSLAARAVFRQLVDRTPGGDFPEHLDALVDDVKAAAERLATSEQVRDALGTVLGPARRPMRAETTDVADLLRFAPEGGLLGGILRSLTATLDLRDGAGFLPLARHGSTTTALFAICELVAAGGLGVVVIDDFGEGLDGGMARHLAAALRQQAGQAILTTRRASVAEAFRPRELVRLSFDDAGQRVNHNGWDPSTKAERLASRHFALQLLPAAPATALLLLEGPHDRAAYEALADRLLRDDNTPLPAADRIAIVDAGAADASGGASSQPRLAEAARRLGFFVVALVDGDTGQQAEVELDALQGAADSVIRLPDGYAIERAIIHEIPTERIRDALSELDVPSSPDFSEIDANDLPGVAVNALKKRGGLHAQFLDALPAGLQPTMARKALTAAIEAAVHRTRGLVQL